MTDSAARARIRDDLDASFVVEAAAGTGKTTALVGRILSLVRAGRTTLDRVIAVTFTDKAAGELELRIRGELELARATAEGVVRSRLEQAITDLEQSRIGTIHALCTQLLRERPIEAGVDPMFAVATADQGQALLDTAFERWFQAALSDPPQGLRRFLRRAHSDGPDGPQPHSLALRRAASDVAEHRDATAPWRHPDYDRLGEMEGLLDALIALHDLVATAPRNDPLVKSLRSLKRLALHLRAEGPDPDGLEARLVALAGEKKAWDARGNDLGTDAAGRAEVHARRDAVKARVDRFVADADADLAALLRDELCAVVAVYEAIKRETGHLDFVDLLVHARDLVRDHPDARAELQRRFTHVFVDEFQDTDPLQAEILLLLAADDPAERDWLATRPAPGKLFVVGDPKQSIYRFRRADVATYQMVVQGLVDRGATLLHLSRSFRAVPAIQHAINAAFEPEMRGSADGHQASWVPLDEARPPHPSQPAVLALPVPAPHSFRGPTIGAIEASWPDAVGAFVHWLVTDSGWTVEEAGQRVPVATRHVALLLKRFTKWGAEDLTRPLVAALQARGHRALLLGGRHWHAREEVLALRNALTAIEWPDDELAVYATLRGPFLGFHDADLVTFKHRFARLQPLRRWPIEARFEGDPLAEIAGTLGLIGELHLHRNDRAAALTVRELLERVRAHASVASWARGEQALANTLRMVELARSFEAGGATSFRAFVEHLHDRAEHGEAAEPPIVEEGVDGVRILTVHKAKGLEFPVVILCDPGAGQAPRDPSRLVDRARGLWVQRLAGLIPIELAEERDRALDHDRAETIRVAYVAATRARDLLVVPVIGDGPLEEEEGKAPRWLAPLNRAVYPVWERRREARPSPGLPPMSGDTVLRRRVGSPSDAFAPGNHTPRAGAHEVTWLSPAMLPLDAAWAPGIRTGDLLVVPESGDGGLAGFTSWRRRRDEAVTFGSRASFPVAAVTRLVEDGVTVEGPRPRVVEVRDATVPRPGGRRFGALVHAVVAEAPIRCGREVIDRIAAVQARVLGATAEERDAAVLAVARAHAHPLFGRIAAAEHRREVPVRGPGPGGTTIEGVVDLAWRSPTGWVLVEIKTDHAWRDRVDQHTAQLSLYAGAVAAVTGEAVQTVLLVL